MLPYYIAGAYENEPVNYKAVKKSVLEICGQKKKIFFTKTQETKPVLENVVKEDLIYKNAVKKTLFLETP